MSKINVLDHGFVRLVSYMQPVPVYTGGDYEGHDLEWSGDLEIIRNARVSYNADWRAGDDESGDAKLIRYLLKNKHTSPFEAMVFTFEIQVPIFIARQWHRHRTWSYNEVSARYAPLDLGYFIPEPSTIGKQSKSNKQMRDIGDMTDEEAAVYHDFELSLRSHNSNGHNLYKYFLEQGIPRELARCFLEVNAYTRYFGTVNLHNLMHFLRLRLHEHAQYEVRQYAEALLGLVESICPITIKAFRESL